MFAYIIAFIQNHQSQNIIGTPKHNDLHVRTSHTYLSDSGDNSEQFLRQQATCGRVNPEHSVIEHDITFGTILTVEFIVNR